ncbi:hypothetical protein BD560DRAFT_440274 [Blakeslea trispora]|nr:hypothetical protein BD560DRAFT_440274 [Blakeslea trispora]
MQSYDSNGYSELSYKNPFKPIENASSMSNSSPELFADDPWKTSNKDNTLFTNLDGYNTGADILTQKDLYEENSELNASNVLLGVDIPDAYINIYAQCSPRQENVSLEKLLAVISLASLSNQVQEKIISLIVAPEMKYVTWNEFNACLALIACGQKNMDVSIETVLRHKNDLPIPSIPNIDEVQRVGQHHGASFASSSNHDQSEEQHQYHIIHQEEQDVMNRWLSDSDHVSVALALEKEGFLFKHVNYELESRKLKTKVLRRFSDFWWLWEVLLRRYPYRIIPCLPPKKLGGRTSVFEERRRKGLARFINVIVQHPTIGCDEVVIAFLSHPSEINSWKRVHNPSLDEEFVRKAHPIGRIICLIPMDLDDRIVRMKRRLSISVQHYERMCYIMNQTSRLKAALGTECIRYSMTLNSISETDRDCWVPGCQGCSQMACGHENISKSLKQAGAMYTKEVAITDGTILESLKQYRDLLEAFKALIDRKERLNPVSSEVLSRLIAKHKKGRVQPAVAHDDVAYYEEPLDSEYIRDQDTGFTLVQQRDVFIKYCLLLEFSFLHKQQAGISAMYNQYVKDQVKYTRQWNEHWRNLEILSSEMPNVPDEFL